MILFVPLERGWSRAREYPPAVIASKQSGRHGGARTDGLRVDNPTLHPIGFQASFGLQEVRRSCGSIMDGIPCGMTLQAGCRVAGEQAARHLSLFRGQRRDFLWNVGKGLA